jgi:hypothetical protein
VPSGDAPAPEPGPAKDGLRLRLTVSSNVEKVDRHVFVIEILNVSDKPITLVAKFIYEGKEEQTYDQYLSRATTFVACPEVVEYGYQTGGRFRQSPQPVATIEPGKTLKAQWGTEGRCLEAYERSWGMPFPTTGRFDIRAQLVLHTDDGREIGLWSNTQQLLVGGADHAPKGCAATVTSADPETGLVQLDGVGPLNGVKTGDRFRIDMPMRGYFVLEVTNGSTLRSTAKIVEQKIFHPDQKDTPQFPVRGMKAGLEPEKPVTP